MLYHDYCTVHGTKKSSVLEDNMVDIMIFIGKRKKESSANMLYNYEQYYYKINSI